MSGLFAMPGQRMPADTDRPGQVRCSCGWTQRCESLDDGLLVFERHLEQAHPTDKYGCSAECTLDKTETG